MILDCILYSLNIGFCEVGYIIILPSRKSLKQFTGTGYRHQKLLSFVGEFVTMTDDYYVSPVCVMLVPCHMAGVTLIITSSDTTLALKI